MESTISIDINADPDAVFALAEGVEHWAEWLPHYRWVRRLATSGPCRVVEMAARRDVIPLRWTAVLEPLPALRRLRFVHIAGPTRGMSVEWRITPTAAGTHVEIWHRYRPAGGRLSEWYAAWVVGRFFIDAVAGRTLRYVKLAAEERAERRPGSNGDGQ
ncbi:MAG: SRPBCC family protein [Dehalococcoidia bacterium]